MHLKNKKKIYTSLGCELIKRNIGALVEIQFNFFKLKIYNYYIRNERCFNEKRTRTSKRLLDTVRDL